MENTEKKTKKFIIYVPLIIAVVLWLLGILTSYFTLLSIRNYLTGSVLSRVITWRLPVTLIAEIMLPLCLIFFYGKKTSRILYKILMITSFVVLGLALMSGSIYAIQMNAILKGDMNISDMNEIIMVLTAYLPGANLFTNMVYISSYFTFTSLLNLILEFISIGNTVFVAILAMKLSKTGEFAPASRNIYQSNPYAAPINARYQTLAAWQGNKSFDSSPAALVNQELILDTLNNTVGVKIKFQNIHTRNIGAIKIDVNCYDPFKTLLGTCQDVILMDINAAPGVFIDIAAPIMLPYNQTRNVEIILKSISFTDGSIWENIIGNLFEE